MADPAITPAHNLRVSVSIDKQVLARLDDYKSQVGLASRSQAVNQILARALGLESAPAPAVAKAEATAPSPGPIPVPTLLIERFTALVRSVRADASSLS